MGHAGAFGFRPSPNGFFHPAEPRVEIAEHEMSALVARDIHFVVFGRQVADGFVVLSDIAADLPEALRSRCSEIGESEFRETVSSTQLRSGAKAPSAD